MSRLTIASAIVLTMLSAVAFAFNRTYVVKVDDSIEPEVLWSLGLPYLADLGDTYLVEGDDQALERLSRVTEDFQIIATVGRGMELYLLKPESPGAEIAYSAALAEVSPGSYLAQVESHAAEDLKLLPFSRVRLVPQRFVAPEISVPEKSFAVIPKPEVEFVVGHVSGDTVWKYISELSGNEPVVINGMLDTLLTRYSYSWRIEHAADYLRERFLDYGYDVAFHEYVTGKYSFYEGDFVDSQNGWVVGSDQRIFRTRDGGQSWVRQKPGALFQWFYGVCFTDTLKGWVVGSNARIYHTSDGGASWVRQYAPGGFYDLEAVCFLDSLNGWVVGAAGKVGRTSDGGASWTDVTSGSSIYLTDLDFPSADHGWIVGDEGTILFWDGSSMSSQTSGTLEWLCGVDFVDDQVGWAVGGNRTVLKTSDGGQSWVAQSVPMEAHPYLMEVCFVDSTEGWVAGGGGTVLHTSDGGTTWEKLDSGTLSLLWWVEFIDSLEGWVAGERCAIEHTADGGDCWEDQKQNLPSGAYTLLKNVVATKPGTVSDEQIIICGHFDSISEDPYNLAPGADDNASGTAAVVEAARVMADHYYENTMKFVCFSGEEQGLCGSSEYAADAKSAGDVILGVLNFDMIAYADTMPEDLELVGNPPSEWLVDLALDCADAYVPLLSTRKIIDETIMNSDHAAFWNAGYNALHAKEDSPIIYPYYHQTSDTLGHLNQAFAADVVRVAVATLAELAVPDTAASGIALNEKTIVITAYPNPFGTETSISFEIGGEGKVIAGIYDVEGRLVRKLHEGRLQAGRCRLVWNGRDEAGRAVSPGIYFGRIKTGHSTAQAKLIVLR
jgi:photosystem II stability/assembly factor-like uncharacterized protein